MIARSYGNTLLTMRADSCNTWKIKLRYGAQQLWLAMR